MQRQRLAGAVATEDGDELAACRIELQVIDEPPTRDADAQAFATKRRFGKTGHAESLAQRRAR